MRKGLFCWPLRAVECNNPEKEQLIDLSDETSSTAQIEHLNARLGHPIRIFKHRELGQGGFDITACGGRVIAETQQRETEALAVRKQLVRFVSILLVLAGAPVFVVDLGNQLSQPGVIFGEPDGHAELARGELELPRGG